MLVKTRFAPSPTGMLHIGNVRTALINWLFARSNNGVFMLRMDDTDILRSKPEYEEAIKEDLQWLGIGWDEFARQSERLARYEEVKNNFIASGRLYPCFESQNDLDMKRKLLLRRGLPPIYDRAGLKLTDEQKEELISQGHKPHYRFKLEDGLIEWDDQIRGNIQFQSKNLSDPIVIREDGSMTYILCSAVDDVDFGITHILRGEDHITNTAIGIQITRALGKEPPIIGHISLLKSKVEKISKRLGGFDIRSLREQFIEPMAIKSLLAKMGSSDSIEAVADISELIEDFKLSKFSLSAVNYDFEELLQLNHKLISNFSYNQIKPSLEGVGVDVDEEFWLSVRGNLNTVNELVEWWSICHKDINLDISIENADFLKTACSLLPEGEWNNSTWGTWVESIKEKTGRAGKDLFMPLRKALTGKESGPELKVLLPLIGRQKVEKRLYGENA